MDLIVLKEMEHIIKEMHIEKEEDVQLDLKNGNYNTTNHNNEDDNDHENMENNNDDYGGGGMIYNCEPLLLKD